MERIRLGSYWPSCQWNDVGCNSYSLLGVDSVDSLAKEQVGLCRLTWSWWRLDLVQSQVCRWMHHWNSFECLFGSGPCEIYIDLDIKCIGCNVDIANDWYINAIYTDWRRTRLFRFCNSYWLKLNMCECMYIFKKCNVFRFVEMLSLNDNFQLKLKTSHIIYKRSSYQRSKQHDIIYCMCRVSYMTGRAGLANK